jgi:hypothetical protein
VQKYFYLYIPFSQSIRLVKNIKRRMAEGVNRGVCGAFQVSEERDCIEEMVEKYLINFFV